MVVEYIKKNVYGVNKLYIVDPNNQKAFTELTGNKTISAEQINAFQRFGVTFTQTLNK